MKKLIALLTALILLFSSVAFAADTYLPVADTPFNTDEYGRPVFTNLEDANQHGNGGMLESDYYIIIVAKDNTLMVLYNQLTVYGLCKNCYTHYHYHSYR